MEHGISILRILKNLTLMSDIFMRNVLKQKECTEHILRVIMDRDDLKVLEQVLQKDYKNLQGRSAILDCVVRDGDGKQFDVEIQQENEGATLNPGEDFDELPECHVIFITQRDVLRRNFPIYHIDRTIRESGEDFGDESHIIYVNSSRQEDTPLGRLMHDFHCKSSADICNDVLAQRVRELKETQEGVEHMCK